MEVCLIFLSWHPSNIVTPSYSSNTVKKNYLNILKVSGLHMNLILRTGNLILKVLLFKMFIYFWVLLRYMFL
jgi:hypothetical protein